MRPLVLYPKNYRRVLVENGLYLLKNLWRNIFLLLKVFKNLVHLVLYVLFVPVKVYKLEGTESLPREVNLKEEYQKHQYPGPRFIN
ncbi:MAG: hypothetical protein R3A80_13020 [Bdellovibrionota bacterium]